MIAAASACLNILPVLHFFKLCEKATDLIEIYAMVNWSEKISLRTVLPSQLHIFANGHDNL